MMPASLELHVFTNLVSPCFFANMQIGSYAPRLMDCLSERAFALPCVRFKGLLEHLTLEMLAYGRQKPAYSHFVARIFRKILAEHLTHFIRKLL